MFPRFATVAVSPKSTRSVLALLVLVGV